MGKRVYFAVFLLVWILEFSVGYYVAHVIGYVHTDAMSRVANAFYVLYSGNPHLGAIGFIWTPLPSLVELPFLLFYPWFPALASSGLAGVIMSSLFAGFTAVLIVWAGDVHGISRWLSVSMSLLFCFNPFIFIFGMNGLSDAPFIFFTMYSIVHLTLWLKNRSIHHLVKLGIALALAFWTRYEAVPFGMGVGLTIILALMFQEDRSDFKSRVKIRGRELYYQMESTLTVVWLPIVFSGLVWIALNYIIMGNPLYFLNSEYSNVEQSAVLATDPKFMRLIGHPWNSFVFVLEKMSFFSIPLLAVVLLKLFKQREPRWDWIELIALFSLVGSIAALQYILLYVGSSYGWFRYFMYSFPIVVAWLPYELSRVRTSFKHVGTVLMSLILSIVVLTAALFDPEIAPDENKLLHAHEHANLQEVDREVAQFLDEELKHDLILMDSYTAFYVILNSKKPSRYVITSDYQFREALEDPQSYGIDYILTPKPNPSSALSAENRMYPNFYEVGTEWTELYKEFGSEYGGLWRLYKVKKGSDES